MGSKQDSMQQSGASTPRAQAGASAATKNEPSRINVLVQYFQDSRAELDKVSWPLPAELKATTLAVLILVSVMALFLGGVDWLLSLIIKSILSIGL